MRLYRVPFGVSEEALERELAGRRRMYSRALKEVSGRLRRCQDRTAELRRYAALLQLELDHLAAEGQQLTGGTDRWNDAIRECSGGESEGNPDPNAPGSARAAQQARQLGELRRKLDHCRTRRLAIAQGVLTLIQPYLRETARSSHHHRGQRHV